MNPRIKCSLLIFLLLFMFQGSVEGSGVGGAGVFSPHMGGVQAHSRKILGMDAMLDYDYAGPNPKHDPRGRRGGGGSKNP